MRVKEREVGKRETGRERDRGESEVESEEKQIRYMRHDCKRIGKTHHRLLYSPILTSD